MRKVGAILCLLIGFLILMIGIIGVFDPIGTQMANDNDPFGEPPGIKDSLFVFGLAVVFFLLAYYFHKHRHQDSKDKATR